MSIPLTGSGGLFVCLGHILSTINSINTFRGTTIPGRIATTEADYAGTNENLIDGINSQLASWQNGNGSLPGNLRTLARKTVIQLVAENVAVPDQSLGTALAAVIAQMTATSQTVQRSAITGTTASGGSNTGNAVCVVSTHLASGNLAENAFAEVITGTVTADAQSGGATAGQESVRFLGQFAVADPLSWLYPAGSGSSLSLRAVSASQYGASSGNLLTDGDFEGTWTANVPAAWHVSAGTAGTQILKSTAQHYDGANSLQFAGDGSTLAGVEQQLGVDTTVSAAPLTQYAVNLWCKTDSPAAGVLEVALVDGSGAILNDSVGNASSFTASLSAIGSTWTAINGSLRTPRVLPAQVWLRIRQSTAITNTNNAWIDRVAMTKPVQAYAQGPGISLFSGNVNLIAGDTFIATIGNTPGGLQYGCNRLFGMSGLGLLFPSVASSPTISDSLIA